MKDYAQIVEKILRKKTELSNLIFTGYKDRNGEKICIGSKVEWIDSEGFPCESEVIIKDCMIGVDSWEGFILVKDFGNKFTVVKSE
ncbi:hypothetical protein PCURB6_27740 [Paenibacillus curdlanolyticus]|nr:hypothetical protein [Paenibacillus curdlanolyticus]GFN32514.1 hypothetical protein PCURB6_27740 [Paenibacillus curdlanolyticus]